MVSGIFSTILTVFAPPWTLLQRLTLSVLHFPIWIERGNFPVLPAGKVMSRGMRLSFNFEAAGVAGIACGQGAGSSRLLRVSGLLGAALILHSDSHGYLLATARHVADGEDWHSHHGSQKVSVVSVGTGRLGIRAGSGPPRASGYCLAPGLTAIPVTLNLPNR